MFYSYELFVKKGPLGKIWMAGTVMKKMTKAAVLSSDVADMCKRIGEPPVPLALPAQSTLLRGVCRIENKKAYFLLGDAIEAKSQVLLVGTRTLSKVDLPREKDIAKKDSITFSDEAGVLELDIPGLTPSQLQAALMSVEIEVSQPRAKPSVATPKLERVSLGPSVDDGSTAAPLIEDFFLEPHEDKELEALEKAGKEKAGPFVEGPQLKPKKKREKKEKELEDQEIEELVPVVPEEEPKSRKKKRRKERPPVDTATELSDEQMKANLRDCSSTLMTHDEKMSRYKWIHDAAIPKEKNAFCANFRLFQWFPEKLKTFFRTYAKPGYPPGWVPPPEEEEVKPPEETVPEFPEIEIESYAPTVPSDETMVLEPEKPADISRVYPSEEAEARREVPKRKAKEQPSPMPTPEVPSTPSEYEFRIAPSKPEVKPVEISKMTEIYRDLLRKQFAAEESKPDAPAIVALDFTESLKEAVRTQLRVEEPRRYDVGVSFQQLLILRQLDIVKVKQPKAFAPMKVEKGKNWDERFSSSQFDASQSQSQSQSKSQSRKKPTSTTAAMDTQETQPPLEF